MSHKLNRSNLAANQTQPQPQDSQPQFNGFVKLRCTATGSQAIYQSSAHQSSSYQPSAYQLSTHQLKSSAHIQSVQLDYQRISIEPCLIGLTQSQVMQRIGQLISLCPVSHQVASLASFSVVQATTCPEISVEQQTQLKQECINTYAMQWMQVAQRLNLTSLWAPIIRLLLTGQHQSGIEAMLQLDSADIQDWLATEKFDAAAIDFAPSSPMFELW
ncbi:hypothetical protein HC723_14560 [Vibrio sp. S11_S32]|uniref:hypothetical protein n=1 Tax=Vibrio sp. S11_S32 TaxID=2720225 RepID=UPI0016813D29|nr:hypothetical protein [Vibrio sp. S11_S32]MBD1577632.1 hypothetical protein [Vibrio sp. S11_S32]